MAAANAHQQLRAIIITASSDNIIIAQSGGESVAICRVALELGGAGEVPHLCVAGLKRFNYPDEGVAGKVTATPARFEPPMRRTAAGVKAAEHLERGFHVHLGKILV